MRRPPPSPALGESVQVRRIKRGRTAILASDVEALARQVVDALPMRRAGPDGHTVPAHLPLLLDVPPEQATLPWETLLLRLFPQLIGCGCMRSASPGEGRLAHAGLFIWTAYRKSVGRGERAPFDEPEE
jgi:hypothetical protein